MTTSSSAYTTRCGEVVTTTRQQDLDPDRVNGAEKLLVMASDGEAGAGGYAWPPAPSDEEVTNTRHAIGQYLIAATAAEPAERQ